MKYNEYHINTGETRHFFNLVLKHNHPESKKWTLYEVTFNKLVEIFKQEKCDELIKSKNKYQLAKL